MEATVVDGNGTETGHIIVTTIGGRNGQPKQVDMWNFIFVNVSFLVKLSNGEITSDITPWNVSFWENWKVDSLSLLWCQYCCLFCCQEFWPLGRTCLVSLFYLSWNFANPFHLCAWGNGSQPLPDGMALN